jgi:hypothetical protein
MRKDIGARPNASKPVVGLSGCVDVMVEAIDDRLDRSPWTGVNEDRVAANIFVVDRHFEVMPVVSVRVARHIRTSSCVFPRVPTPAA